MIKNLPLKKGYTILELIISVFILIVVFSIAQANYRRFILSKSLDSVRSQIISDIRLAQAYSLNGKKSSTCLGLNGYSFSFNIINNATSYSIIALCGSSSETVKTVTLSSIAKGVTVNVSSPFTPATPSMTFKVLGMGTNIPVTGSYIININQQTTSDTRTITITSAGEVK